MKRILSIALFVAALGFSSQAQEKVAKQKKDAKQKTEATAKKQHHAKHKGQKGKHDWNRGQAAELNLTTAQQEQMKSINSDFRNQAKAIKENSSLSEDQKKQQVRSLHTKRKEAMKAVLTSEQQQKIAQSKKSRKKQHNREGSTK